ncbi:YhcN/YlaJ family sporulation lipoprotein [Paenibacillus sp. J5C_2022]|uniref:YhcN/YlaJ family sporulation lipoprotein n=1 Tax=Paenibacillus sp. J5C2022 TaxID=2977129 RepID=UPI0021CE3F45|nr:YhcN/YlaJ family sporulation lipoprotein [Paenibacillus sp. J5C2022]MCU6707395.1 YhcN/YlaJ family sporulation lipoprotein [Paenibacillus sp. J5C2022]
MKRSSILLLCLVACLLIVAPACTMKTKNNNGVTDNGMEAKNYRNNAINKGMRGYDREMRGYDGNRDYMNQRYTGKNNTMNERVDIAEKAADSITTIKGVKSANVFVTRNNAYVAALTDTGKDLSKDMEKQIADKVRATDANIHHVYVSTNPELMDRMNTYMKDVREGRPVSGFVQEFNDMIMRIFPNDE